MQKKVSETKIAAAAAAVIEEKEVEMTPDDGSKLSKKALRKKNRLGIAELKQLVQKPDVVEVCFYLPI